MVEDQNTLEDCPISLDSLSQEILSEALRRGLKIGFAESCTGGALSAQMTRLPGVSKVFNGSIVAYSNSLKERLLNVASDDLKSFGAVSAQVAEGMAKGALVALEVDFAISLTGIAGPDGGTFEKPVGLVWFGRASRGARSVSEKKVFKGSREQIQRQAVEYALKLLKDGIINL